MAIIDYDYGVSRDTAVLGDNVYAGNGQGCGTVWYPTVKQARRVIDRLAFTPDGRDSGLCEVCACHYSFGTEEFNKYPEFACGEWKGKVARGEITEIKRG